MLAFDPNRLLLSDLENPAPQLAIIALDHAIQTLGIAGAPRGRWSSLRTTDDGYDAANTLMAELVDERGFIAGWIEWHQDHWVYCGKGSHLDFYRRGYERIYIGPKIALE